MEAGVLLLHDFAGGRRDGVVVVAGAPPGVGVSPLSACHRPPGLTPTPLLAAAIVHYGVKEQLLDGRLALLLGVEDGLRQVAVGLSHRAGEVLRWASVLDDLWRIVFTGGVGEGAVPGPQHLHIVPALAEAVGGLQPPLSHS